MGRNRLTLLALNTVKHVLKKVTRQYNGESIFISVNGAEIAKYI